MLSKNKIKYIQQLHSKKQRHLKGEFLIEGPKLLKEALKNGWKIKEVYATKGYLDLEKNAINQDELCLKSFETSEQELSKIGNLQTNKHVAALVGMKQSKVNPELWKNEFSLVLDDIKDPGNLGTILRTASWFGIKSVFCSESCVDVFNPKVIQASMGAVFSVNVLTTDIQDLCKEGSQVLDFPIFGAFLEGEKARAIKHCNKGFLILGSESHGVSASIEQFVSNKITIAKSLKSDTESLNVAVAAAILCYELTDH